MCIYVRINVWVASGRDGLAGSEIYASSCKDQHLGGFWQRRASRIFQTFHDGDSCCTCCFQALLATVSVIAWLQTSCSDETNSSFFSKFSPGTDLLQKIMHIVLLFTSACNQHNVLWQGEVGICQRLQVIASLGLTSISHNSRLISRVLMKDLCGGEGPGSIQGSCPLQSFCVNIEFFGCYTHLSHIAASPCDHTQNDNTN